MTNTDKRTSLWQAVADLIRSNEDKPSDDTFRAFLDAHIDRRTREDDEPTEGPLP